MNLKCIIFDLDGTLADTLPLCLGSFQKALKKFSGKDFTFEEIESLFGRSEEGIIKALVPECWQECLKYFLDTYKNDHYICPKTFSGITEALDILKGNDIKLAMVTGKGYNSAVISLNYLKLDHYFEIVETGSSERPNKEDNILSVLSKLGLNAKESAYMGDTPYDIEVSHATGVLSISAGWASTTNLEQIKKQNPSLIFENVDSFIDWINTNIVENKNLSKI